MQKVKVCLSLSIRGGQQMIRKVKWNWVAPGIRAGRRFAFACDRTDSPEVADLPWYPRLESAGRLRPQTMFAPLFRSQVRQAARRESRGRCRELFLKIRIHRRRFEAWPC